MSTTTEAPLFKGQRRRELLLSKGADPNQAHVTLGTAIFTAAKHGKVGIVRVLVEAKVNLETKGSMVGRLAGHTLTPLMVASLNGHTEIVELLCQAGAAVNATSMLQGSELSGSGAGRTLTTTWVTNTALSLAAQEKHADTVAVLCKYGGKGPTE